MILITRFIYIAAFLILKQKTMRTKLFAFTACLFMLMSCGDSSSTDNQGGEAQQTEENQISSQSAQEQDKSSKIDLETAKRFIPDGFQIVSYEDEVNFLAGNFDGDEAQDFVVMIASGEAEFPQDAADVRIVIYEQQSDKSFAKVAESGNLEGYFIHDAPTSQLHLNENVLSIKRQDMRFDNEWKFRYEESIGDYALIGSEYNNYGNAAGDGSGNRSTNYLSGKRIEKFSEWDAKNEKLNERPAKTISVNSVKEKPILLKALNAESFYDL